jgi:signal transduction histidine kinase
MGRPKSHKCRPCKPSRRASANSQYIDRPIPSNAQQKSAAELSARVVQRLSVLGEMTGGIAHDFRNILAVIDSGLSLAEHNSDDLEKMRGYLAGAREGVERGARLTSQLLMFAKQREHDACAADVNSLLKSLELFLKYGAGCSVRITFDLAPTIPKCLVDQSQFAAAILNLIINARDAMPKGGEVRISTCQCEVNSDTYKPARPEIYVRVTVTDNGLGMSEQVVRRISEPFFTTKGEKGTGLGIPQVCAYMRHVGGHVNVASELGLGTTFDLLFPAVTESTSNPRRGDTVACDAPTRYIQEGNLFALL